MLNDRADSAGQRGRGDRPAVCVFNMFILSSPAEPWCCAVPLHRGPASIFISYSSIFKKSIGFIHDIGLSCQRKTFRVWKLRRLSFLDSEESWPSCCQQLRKRTEVVFTPLSSSVIFFFFAFHLFPVFHWSPLHSSTHSSSSNSCPKTRSEGLMATNAMHQAALMQVQEVRVSWRLHSTRLQKTKRERDDGWASACFFTWKPSIGSIQGTFSLSFTS